jgi:hypothetical protein
MENGVALAENTNGVVVIAMKEGTTGVAEAIRRDIKIFI